MMNSSYALHFKSVSFGKGENQMQTTCRFGEDTDCGVYCERFSCACDGEKECGYYIKEGDLTEEEYEFMREMTR